MRRELILSHIHAKSRAEFDPIMMAGCSLQPESLVNLLANMVMSELPEPLLPLLLLLPPRPLILFPPLLLLLLLLQLDNSYKYALPVSFAATTTTTATITIQIMFLQLIFPTYFSGRGLLTGTVFGRYTKLITWVNPMSNWVTGQRRRTSALGARLNVKDFCQR